MKTQTIVIPSKEATRRNGEVVVAFDPDVVGPNPIVLVTPRWDDTDKAVTNIPTVTGIHGPIATKKPGQEIYEITISDSLQDENYYLNILLINPEAEDVHGQEVSVESKLKNQTGTLNLSGDVVDGVDMLTPYWKGNHGPVGGIETMNMGGTVGPTSVSINTAEDYFVNHVQVKKGAIEHNIQAGHQNKNTGLVKRIMFEKKWDTPPVVFATPYWRESSAPVGSVETVSKVTETYFEVTSKNKDNNYFVNWMAVTSHPKFSKPKVDEAFNHFLKHFPEQKDKIHQHRHELEMAILTGKEPSQVVQNIEFDVKPELPNINLEPNVAVAETNNSNIIKDIAFLAIDGIALILSCIGAGVAANAARKNAQLVDAVSALLQEKPTVTTALVNSTQRLIRQGLAALNAADKANANAKVMLHVAKAMVGVGAIKAIVTALLSTLSWWQWVIVGVKLLAQLLVILAGSAVSAGAAAAVAIAGWVARIAALLLSAVQVALDIYKLIEDLNKKHQQGAADIRARQLSGG